MEAGAAISTSWDVAKQTGACCYARTKYFDDLEADISNLNSEISLLERLQEEVERRVREQLDQNPQMQQHYKVTFWLERVNWLKEDVDSIRPEAEEELRHKNLRFFFPKKFWYFDRVGNRVKKKLQEVTDRMKDGDFEQVVEKKPRDLVGEMKMEKTVGLESKFDEVRGYMEDTRTGAIGLCGMGGVGKTTLLRMLHNRIYEARKKGDRGKSENDLRSFNFVMWVDVSKEGGVGNIQEAIFKKLDISEEKWKDKSESERAEEIWRLLRIRRFALLLDDLGEQTGNNDPWDLSRVGVPADCNDNGSKVVFTTRHENTCRVMRARTIRVGCLPRNEALELFRDCVGEATMDAHHEIRQLAERVVEACVGLPLALVIMGQSMKGKIDPLEWERVIGKLQRSPVRHHSPRSSMMEDCVFPVLKVSYENLDGDILRTCFLYFSVFLEVHNLKKEELIELWIAEGFLADHDGMHHCGKEGEQHLAEKKKRGEVVIQSLKDACLLESGESTNSITMHDITHAMTLWLAREEGKEENKVVVQRGKIDFAKWNDAERLYIWGPGIDSVSQTPSCHRLTTLMVRATKLKTFPSELFPSMPGLRVLNLSDNRDLSEVPEDIGQLRNLLYLNLSWTSIKVLPLEFQNLTCLEVLLLDSTMYLETIPSKVIGGLLSLQVFSRTFEWQRIFYPMVGAVWGNLDGLEILEHVYEIRITLTSADSIQRLLNSPKLRKCIKLLTFVGLELLNSPNFRLDTNDSVNIARNFVGQECFPNLTHVEVHNCAVENMSWLAYALKLQILRLSGCWKIVEVVGDAGVDLFSNLTHLTLGYLPNLKRISNCTLPLPCLRILDVHECLRLRVLPFDFGSAKNLEEIRGERTWWKRLKWTSKADKLVFSPKFNPVWELGVVHKVVLMTLVTAVDCLGA